MNFKENLEEIEEIPLERDLTNDCELFSLHPSTLIITNGVLQYSAGRACANSLPLAKSAAPRVA